MNYQPLQHTPTTQWSASPENQQQQMSQHPSLQHQIVPYRPSGSAASPSLPQVSCSVKYLVIHMSVIITRNTFTNCSTPHTKFTQHSSVAQVTRNWAWNPYKPSVADRQEEEANTPPNGDSHTRAPVPIQLTESIRRNFASLWRRHPNFYYRPSSNHKQWIRHAATCTQTAPDKCIWCHKSSGHGEIPYWNLGGRTILL